MKKRDLTTFSFLFEPCFFLEKWFAERVDIFYNEAAIRRRAYDA
jgi:hypothetical protein